MNLSPTTSEFEPALSESLKLVQSDRFCASDADITFKSCDNVLFNVHRKNLDVHSEGFGPPDGTTTTKEDQIVTLSETAVVLELIFQFMYPMRQPDLKKVEFSTLKSLSETAEKYQVFSAMEMCKCRMEALTSQHPFDVLSYATKHGYTDLVDAAAMGATGWTLSAAYAALTPEIYIAWTRYYGLWVETLDFAHSQGPHSHVGVACDLWKRIFVQISSRLGGNPGSLRNLDIVFRPQEATPTIVIDPTGHTIAISGRQVNQSNSCSLCFQTIMGWRDRVRQKLQALPKFSTFL